MYLSQASQVKMVSDPASLDPLFLRRENRKVRQDATISIGKRLFEVPPRFIGQSVEVRFEPDGGDEVLIYEDGNEVARVRPVNLADTRGIGVLVGDPGSGRWTSSARSRRQSCTFTKTSASLRCSSWTRCTSLGRTSSRTSA
jgi:hypothetical protein